MVTKHGSQTRLAARCNNDHTHSSTWAPDHEGNLTLSEQVQSLPSLIIANGLHKDPDLDESLRCLEWDKLRLK